MSDDTKLAIGDIARFKGLVDNAHMNGRYVEIVRNLENVRVQIPGDRVREAPQYGIIPLGSEHGGYALPEQLEFVCSGSDFAMVRACWIHETGWEPPESKA